MKREIASILIVIALIIGAALGYLANATSSKTTTERVTQTYITTNTRTETAISTYTITTTLPQTNITTSPRQSVLLCIVTEYEAINMLEIENSTTTTLSFPTTSTMSTNVQTYKTIIPTSQSAGFETTTTSYPNYSSSTRTGAILSSWTTTVCTIVFS